ncbi:MAG: hypothetical protein PHG85_01935 [Candidatus Altiarchaeota archaeon]|nr:hypothetical protein [Candidatus Altiarchaeota archaeon]
MILSHSTLKAAAVVIFIAALAESASASMLELVSNYSIGDWIQEKIYVQRVEIVDIDNTGMGEVLLVTTGKAGTPYAQYKNSVYVFNRNGTIRWQYGVDREILASILKDVNNDLNIETVISSGVEQEKISRGVIRVINKDGELMYQYSRTAIAGVMSIDDANDDKYYELLTGSEQKLMLLFVDGDKIWEYPESGTLNATVHSVGFIDVDHDTEMEFMYASDRLYFLETNSKPITDIELESNTDPAKRDLFFISPVNITYSDYPSIIAVSKGNNYVYAVEIQEMRINYDPDGNKIHNLKLNIKWKYEFFNNINKIQIYDVDKDNYDEIVIANEDGTLQVIDNTGTQKWAFRLSGPAKDFVITDVDGDGQTEILTISYSGPIYALSLNGDLLWSYDTNLRLDKIAAGDLDSDGIREIAMTSDKPSLYVYQLNNSLLQKMKADAFYAQAERFFVSSSYGEAKSYLQQARDIYGRYGFDVEVQKVQVLLNRIDYQMSEERRKLGDVYYEKAQEYYITGDYSMSEKYVGMAKDVYREFGDSENVLKCELLELRIKTVGQPTLASTTSLPKNETGVETGGADMSMALAFGGILLVGLLIAAFFKKRMEDRKDSSTKKVMEDELASKVSKMDFDNLESIDMGKTGEGFGGEQK